MGIRQIDLLQGTLDLLILKSLSTGANHGYGIATRIHQLSDDVLKVEEGSLYPALYRMEEQGLIDSEWARDRKQPQGEVLQADAQRALCRAGGSRGMAAVVERSDESAPRD